MSIDLPIESVLRGSLILFHWTFTILCFELVFIFILKYRNRKTLKLLSKEIAFLLLFSGIAILSIFQLYVFYYQENGTVELPLLFDTVSLGLVILNFGHFIFILLSSISIIVFKIIEIEFFKNKVIVSLYSLFPIWFISVFLFNPHVSLIISFLNWIILSYVWIKFCFQINQPKKGSTKNSDFVLLIVPMILLGLGFFSNSNMIINFIPNHEIIMLIGNLMNLIGILIYIFIFLRDNRLLETEWRENIEEIFIMNKQGACIFYKNLKLDEKDIDEQLISGAITSMNIVLQEMTDSVGIGRSNIQKKNKLISLYSSELITSVCISRYEANFIDYILKELVNRVETIYESTLNDWDGNTDIFLPIEFILNKLI